MGLVVFFYHSKLQQLNKIKKEKQKMAILMTQQEFLGQYIVVS